MATGELFYCSGAVVVVMKLLVVAWEGFVARVVGGGYSLSLTGSDAEGEAGGCKGGAGWAA